MSESNREGQSCGGGTYVLATQLLLHGGGGRLAIRVGVWYTTACFATTELNS